MMRNRRGPQALKLLALLVLPPLLCCDSGIPDQSQFVPLDNLLTLNSPAFVRLYSAAIPDLEGIATHPWFLTKAKNAKFYSRWEVWQDAGGPYGHVRQNLLAAEEGVGAGGVFVVDELYGASAEAVVAFIDNQSPNYPCRDNYVLLGPNSNSYAQWVLDNTGWNAQLPGTAIGKDTPCQ